MYYEVGIQKLSDNQLSKMRNGHPVRVKVGNHHKIALSEQQIKKLQKASKKGAASTISFDPYQLEAHGSGILGDIGRKAKALVQKYKLQDIVNPVINRVKKESHKGVSKLSNFAHSKINELQPVESGEGIIGDVLGVLGSVAKTAGFGVKGRKRSPASKPKTKGKGILTDLAKTAVKSVAQKGIDLGADYLKDKVSGMGNARFAKTRRIRGRKAPNPPSVSLKKTSGGSGFDGGALYPAGMGGALYPAGCGFKQLPYRKVPMMPH